MELGNIASWAGTLVSASVGTIALWQARTARRQALQAERSASAAEDQAKIANEQLKLSSASSQKGEIEEKRSSIQRTVNVANDLYVTLKDISERNTSMHDAAINSKALKILRSISQVDPVDLSKHYDITDTTKRGVGFQVSSTFAYAGKVFQDWGNSRYSLGFEETSDEDFKHDVDRALDAVQSLIPNLYDELTELTQKHRDLQLDNKAVHPD